MADAEVEETTDASRQARKTAGGFLVITGAKAWFLVSATILNFGLPLLFATPADYGTYSIVVNAVSLLNMVVITGSLQAVAKLVSERPSSAKAVLARAQVLQLGVGLPLALAYFFLAGPLASWLHDPAYAPLFRVSAVIIAAYSFYALYVGCLNGLEEFTKQAMLDITFATLRTGIILGAVGLGFGVMGAIAGFGIAAIIIALLAAIWVARFLRGKREDDEAVENEEIDSRRLTAFLLMTMLYTFVLNALMRVDLFLLKRISGDAPGVDEVVYEVSNAVAGAYSLMLNIARMPYQAVIAIAFVIFPMLSKATFADDAEATRSYVRNTMRYSLLIVGAFAAILGGAGADLARPVFVAYAYAGSSLPVLCAAYAAFALIYVATTMLIAADEPLVATGLLTATTVASAALCVFMVESGQTADVMINQASFAMAMGMGGGLVATGVVLYRRFGAFLPLASGIRLVVVIAAVIAIGELTSFTRIFDLTNQVPDFGAATVDADPQKLEGKMGWFIKGAGKAAGLGLLYLVLLGVSGEVGKSDWNKLKSMIKRKRKPADQT